MEDVAQKGKIREENVATSAGRGCAEMLYRLGPEFIRETSRKIQEMAPESADVLGEEEKKYLALLRLKDDISFVHSIEVMNVGSWKFAIFTNELRNEGVSRETFLIACALHDIGKIRLPDCVLKDTTTWPKFEEKFFIFKNQNPAFVDERLRKMGLLSEGQSITDFTDSQIKEMNLNYRNFVSLEFLFSGSPEKLKELQNYHIDPATTSFFEVIQRHEDDSREIVEGIKISQDKGINKEIVVGIVSSRHGYKKTGTERSSVSGQGPHPTALANELLHLADVYHAIRQERPYKKPMSEIEALYFLVTETQKGIFQKPIARRWIRHSVEELEKADYDFSKEDLQKYRVIQAFVEVVD